MKFLEIKNQTSHKAELYIYGDIVNDSWNFGWDEDPNVYPMDIQKMLDGVKGKELDVYINSGGGHMFAGVAISNMLSRHDGKTRAIVDGLAASAASIIAFGCSEVVIPANGYLMIHKPMNVCIGNSDDMLKMADTLERLQEGIVNTYMKLVKEGITREEISTLVDAETWLNGEAAAEIFNVTVTEELGAVAVVGDLAEKLLQKTPRLNIKKENPKKKKEVEIALMLV